MAILLLGNARKLDYDYYMHLDSSSAIDSKLYTLTI